MSPPSLFGSVLSMITFEPAPSSSAAVALSKPALTRFLKRAQSAAGLTGDVDVLLADDATLKRLNRSYRGKNKATDVLSFPAAEEHGGEMAGDLAISLDTAAHQAKAHGHDLGKEVRILMLHGLLHLAGYDHETDSGEMAAREAELRRELRLPQSLTERSEASDSKRPVAVAAARRRRRTAR